MSRAFVKEDDVAGRDDGLPERVHSSHPGYITPRGLAALKERVNRLSVRRTELESQDDDLLKDQELKQVERDLRYLRTSVERAIVVDPAQQPRDAVRFGAVVRLEDEHGQPLSYEIVGEDEADVDAGRVSWLSPLARSLLGRQEGDVIQWERPSGTVELEIISVEYASQPQRNGAPVDKGHQGP